MVNNTEYSVIIDTNEYSGNFERELTAYTTGHHTEYAGEEEAKDYQNFVDANPEFSELFQSNIRFEYDEGGGNYCCIYPTPGRVNDGKGNHYDEIDYTGEHKYPAYESVEIFFYWEPTPIEMRIIEDRAIEYGKKHGINIKAIRIHKTEINESCIFEKNFK